MDKKNTASAYTYSILILYLHFFKIATLLYRRQEMVYIILIFIRPWRYIGVPILLDR